VGSKIVSGPNGGTRVGWIKNNGSTVGVGDDPRVVVGEVLEAAVVGPTSDKNLKQDF
jgi:hypothetical protein